MTDGVISDLSRAGSVEIPANRIKRFFTLSNIVLIISLLLIVIYFFSLQFSSTSDSSINANAVNSQITAKTPKLVEIEYFYYSNNCQSCLDGKTFLEGIKKNNHQVRLTLYEMSYDPENEALFKKKIKDYSLSGEVTLPVTIIGEKYWNGFTSPISFDMESYINQLTSEQ